MTGCMVSDGCEADDYNKFHALNAIRYDAPLNLFYVLALDAAAKVADGLGDECSKAAFGSLSESIKPEIHEMFWDANAGAYRTYAGDGAKTHHSELVQALAILANVCTENIAASLRAKLAQDDNGLTPATLSYCLYKFQALLTDPANYRERVLDMIARDWGYMLANGATSFWETIKGSSDFDNAGSLCHGWSGIPAYFYHVIEVLPDRDISEMKGIFPGLTLDNIRDESNGR